MGGWLKLLHIIGAIAWLGPVFGAWWVYLAARRGRDPALLRWAAARMHEVLVVEHVGLALLLGTGMAQLVYYGGWPLPGTWLWWKLLLVAAVLLPAEAADIYLSHHLLRRALAAPDAAFRRAIDRHDRWLWAGGTLIVAAAVLILALAVLKP